MACELENKTDNPICSDSLQDLKNNTIIMDQLINSEEFEVPDRLGIPRKTWAGLEKDVQDSLINLDPKIERLIAEKIIAQGGIQVLNKWVRLNDAPPSTEFLMNNLGYVTPEMFGAVGDGVADDTMSMLSLPDDAPIFGTGKYLITSDVDFRGKELYLSESEIVANNGAKIIIGGSSNRHINKDQKLGIVTNGIDSWLPSDFTSPTILVSGTKNQNISIGITDYILLEAGNYDSDSSIAYNNIDIKFFVKLGINGKSNTSWVNENKFNLSRGVALEINGDYSHNNNIFSGGVFEDSNSYITVNSGDNNVFNIRAEGGRPINLGSRTKFNILNVEFISSVSGVSNTISVSDFGKYNKVRTRFDSSSIVTDYTVNQNSPRFNRGSLSAGVGSKYLTTKGTNTVIYNLLPITFKCNDDILQVFNNGEDNYQYRLYLTIRNSEGKILTDTDVNVGTFSNYNSLLKRWEFLIQGDLPLGRTIVVDSENKEVVSLFFSIASTSDPNTRCSATDFNFRHLSSSVNNTQGVAMVNLVTEKPTEVLGAVGTEFININNGDKYVLVYSEDFEVISSSQGSSITVSGDASNVKADDRILVRDVLGSNVWATVDSVSGSIISTRGTWVDIDSSIKVIRVI